MADSQATTVVPEDNDNTVIHQTCVPIPASTPALSRLALLEHAPATYILPTHCSEDEIQELEELLLTAGAPIVHQVNQAQLILTSVRTARRAKFELQARGLTTHARELGDGAGQQKRSKSTNPPAKKRRRLTGDAISGLGPTYMSHTKGGALNAAGEAPESAGPLSQLSIHDDINTDDESLVSIDSHVDLTALTFEDNNVRVLQSDWLRDSMQAGKVLDMSAYLIYEGVLEASGPADVNVLAGSEVTFLSKLSGDASATAHRQAREQYSRAGRRDRNAAAAAKDLAGRPFMPSSQPAAGLKRRLLHETTTEHDEAAELPDLPDWVIQNKVYACERAAPRNPVNGAFVELLKKIRLARILVGDEIGVRAYSTSIASIISYPYLLSSAKEVILLPGCDQKVGHLLVEYLDTGHVQAADEVDKDPVLSVLNDFYKIWGVGAATAREFYYDRGWRDHDDLIEYGWQRLNRHQQIGLKYFAEFEQKLSRSEVEFIASVVTYHAKKLIDDDVQCVIVGGYRRGKEESGDVDLIISHPHIENTKFLITPLINALERSGWITHTLILSETASARDQETLPLKGHTGDQRRSGFDTLDKALVVWQDPNWTSRERDLAEDPAAKNPNVHRRVDIIISPWRTIGCAVAGWTSGTTFQRDLRRYARREKGWKYDSSGVRDISSGKWIDLEQWHDKESRSKLWMQAEKRVFEGLGLPWREPENRNTA